MTSKLNLSQIRLDDQLQSRVAVDPAVVDEYRQALSDEAKFPPVTVFFDGETNWLVDGFHRYMAMENTGRAYIEVRIIEGSFRDALLFSSCANGTHGLNRTNADKRKAVINLLNDAEWKAWSDRAIARKLNVSHPLVAEVRASLEANQNWGGNSSSTSQESSPRAITVNTIKDTQPEKTIACQIVTEHVEPRELAVPVVTDTPTGRTYAKNGQVKTMKVANIGKRLKREPSQGSNDTDEPPVSDGELYGDLDLAAELKAALKKIGELEAENERLRKVVERDTQAQEIERLNKALAEETEQKLKYWRQSSRQHVMRLSNAQSDARRN